MRKNQSPYNLIVIGGGTAGLVAAAGTAGLGGRVALIERRKMGGDCLNFGCVPSKALIASARRAQAVREAGGYGIGVDEPRVDFQAVMQRVRARRAAIEPHDSRERFESLGVDVFFGEASFTGPHEVRVTGEDEARLTAKNVVIAAGGGPIVPPIDGLNHTRWFTNETIFDQLDSRPERLGIIGGGPIGCEMAQTFARLGSRIVLIEGGGRLLSKEDEEVSAFVRQRLEMEGVEVRCGVKLAGVRPAEEGGVRGGRLVLGEEAQPASSSDASSDSSSGGAGGTGPVVDALLLAVGRRPNLEAMNLEAAGVRTGRQGLVVNRYLQTTAPHIYAAGDVTGGYLFTHVADAQARVVVRNVLMPWWKQAFDTSAIPWCTYLEPEVATVGMNEKAAARRGVAYDLWELPMEDLDRAVVADETAGFARVLTEKGGDRVLGATLVAAHAGELMHEFALAIRHKLGLADLAGTIHAYPTLAESARKVGDQYQRSKLTPRIKKLMSWWYQRQRASLKSAGDQT